MHFAVINYALRIMVYTLPCRMHFAFINYALHINHFPLCINRYALCVIPIDGPHPPISAPMLSGFGTDQVKY